MTNSEKTTGYSDNQGKQNCASVIPTEIDNKICLVTNNYFNKSSDLKKLQDKKNPHKNNCNSKNSVEGYNFVEDYTVNPPPCPTEAFYHSFQIL